jgi:hypothetical protein
MTFVGCRC